MSDSVWPHRRQPTRLCHPWDSPGKNAGVGCHFLLQCMKVKSESEVAQSCPTLSDPVDCSLPGSSVHGIFQAKVLEWGAIALYFSFQNEIIHSRETKRIGKEIKSVNYKDISSLWRIRPERWSPSSNLQHIPRNPISNKEKITQNRNSSKDMKRQFTEEETQTVK